MAIKILLFHQNSLKILMQIVGKKFT
jgi:hypothetical protein